WSACSRAVPGPGPRPARRRPGSVGRRIPWSTAAPRSWHPRTPAACPPGSPWRRSSKPAATTPRGSRPRAWAGPPGPRRWPPAGPRRGAGGGAGPRRPAAAPPAGRAVGKSFLVAGLVLWWVHTRPRSLVITTGPDFRQVVSVLWKELRRALRTAPVPLGYDHL